jgi:RNA polymerase sigma factor (sigma-70 family)
VEDPRTDAELLRRVTRDGEAFTVLYARHAPNILRWLQRASTDRQVALELTAETFAVVLEKPREFVDRGSGDAGGWIFGIARNLLRTYWRAARIERAARQRLGILEETSQFSIDDTTVLDRIDAGLHRTALHDALSTLPTAQREAIELRVIDELPYADIAVRLGCADAVARLRVSRGLALLRHRLTLLPSGGADE